MLILVFMTILGTLLMGRLKIAEMTRADSRPPPEETAEYELNILRAAVELFQRDCRRYPREEEGFWALLVNPGNTSWDGPYVNVVKRDPWRNPYRYIVTSNAVTVASNGPDGEPDTADDLSPTDWPVLMPPPPSSASLPGP